MSIRNLLNADFARLAQSKLFWASLAVSSAMAVGLCLDFKTEPVLLILVTVLLIAYVLAVFPPLFCTLFAGKDLSDGIVKNRIAVGAKRHEIYISLTVVCSIAVFLNYAVYKMLGMLITSITEKKNVMSPNHCMQIICAFFICFTLVSIILLPVAALRRRSAAAAVCFIMLPVLIVFEVNIASKLSEPETETNTYEYIYGEDGSLSDTEFITPEELLEKYPDAVISSTDEGFDITVSYPNEKYIGGARRAIYGFLEKFLPLGQIMRIPKTDGDRFDAAQFFGRAALFAARSVCATAFFTAVGIFLFRRKNIF